MPVIIDARNMRCGAIGSTTGGNTSGATRNNVALIEPWDDKKEYLKGDMVTNDDKLYQAIKTVPQGIDILDTGYWRFIVGSAAEPDSVDALWLLSNAGILSPLYQDYTFYTSPSGEFYYF